MCFSHEYVIKVEDTAVKRKDHTQTPRCELLHTTPKNCDFKKKNVHHFTLGMVNGFPFFNTQNVEVHAFSSRFMVKSACRIQKNSQPIHWCVAEMATSKIIMFFLNTVYHL